MSEAPTQAERTRAAPQCRPCDLQAAFQLLGWSRRRAAIELGVVSRHRVGEWLRGQRACPPYVQAHIRFRLGLMPADPWPDWPWIQWRVVMPKELAAACEPPGRTRRRVIPPGGPCDPEVPPIGGRQSGSAGSHRHRLPAEVEPC